MPQENYTIQDVTIPVSQLFETIHSESVPKVLLPPGIALSNVIIQEPEAVSDHLIGLFSSGSTGTPKCIWNSYARLQHNAAISADEFEITEDDRLLMMAKPWHVAGFSWLLMSIHVGCEFRFVTTQKGEKQKWEKAIEEYDPTCLFTVPAVLRSLYEYDDWFVPRIFLGGSPLEPRDYVELKKHSKLLYQGYGQTEAGGLISSHKVDLAVDIFPTEHSCYGQSPSAIEVNCKGRADKPDTIYVKSPTAARPGFYDTGDLGYFDEKGMLHLVGRKG